jgi:hypothetical protein
MPLRYEVKGKLKGRADFSKLNIEADPKNQDPLGFKHAALLAVKASIHRSREASAHPRCPAAVFYYYNYLRKPQRNLPRWATGGQAQCPR